MADSQRNFRSAYLGKVVAKGAEEKKLLDNILNDRHVDISKLEEFCEKNHVPATYRSYIWQIILGVLPAHQEVRDFVRQQRVQQYRDLRETLTVMQRVSDGTPPSHALLKMHLMEQGRLPLCENKLHDDLNNQAFLAISDGISQIEDDPVFCYWLSTRIYRLQEKHKHCLGKMEDQLESFLKKEDCQLHGHLVATCSMAAIPSTLWFKSLFAGALPESAFGRICDTVIGGSFQFLVCVAISALIAVRRPLLSKNNTEDLVKYLDKFPDESGDIIVKKSAELWQKYASFLVPTTFKSDIQLHTDRGHS